MTLKDVLPRKPSGEQIKTLRKSKQISMLAARKVLMDEWRKDAIKAMRKFAKKGDSPLTRADLGEMIVTILDMMEEV